MEKLELKATPREETGKKLNSFRKQKKMPGVLYGHKLKNKNLFVDYLDFKEVYKKASGSTLIDLSVGKEKPIKVLIQDVQVDPVSDNFLHVDFYQVKMDEKITAEIGLKFIGESPAEKELSGVLVKNIDKIKVACLPQYLVHEIIVDVFSLKTFEDEIRIANLSLPQEIQVLEDKDEIVAHVLPPKSEEEIKKELEEEVEEKIEKVEVAEKGKKEEEGEEESAVKPAPGKKEKGGGTKNE